MRVRAASTLAGAIVFVLASGCSRKAPGPIECHDFSLRAAGVSRHEQERLEPRIRNVVEDLTVRCLTTPFDRQLIACVERGGELRACYFEFQARHPERAARAITRAP